MKQERYEKYSERFDNDESAIGNPETWGKRVLTEEDIFSQKDIDAITAYINKETSKQERMYSEEDMKKAFNAGEENVNNCYTYMPFEEWFEQFKNK